MNPRRLFFVIAVAVVFLRPAFGYDQWAPDCESCHNPFLDSPYVSPKGTTWPDSLHQVHRAVSFMDTNCPMCHVTTGDNPLTNASGEDGAGASPGYGCAGCHGNLDGPDIRGYGLRLHHAGAAVTCSNATCHTADGPPPAETAAPPNYGTAGTLADVPCNDDLATSEDWSGDGEGLDNDGDGFYDVADPDCSGGCADADGDLYSPDGGGCGPVDCDDGDMATNPGATETCNGIDDNCDTQTDEGFSLGTACDGVDADLCDEGVTECAGCSDATGDSVETCNALDDDCDGTTDGMVRDCANACGPGTETCAGGAWGACTAPDPCLLDGGAADAAAMDGGPALDSGTTPDVGVAHDSATPDTGVVSDSVGEDSNVALDGGGVTDDASPDRGVAGDGPALGSDATVADSAFENAAEPDGGPDAESAGAAGCSCNLGREPSGATLLLSLLAAATLRRRLRWPALKDPVAAAAASRAACGTAVGRVRAS